MLLILALILVAGMGVFLFRLVRDGRQWVSFPANQAVYSDGVLTVGTLTDRNGTVLAGVSDGQRTYAAYESVRRGCLHVVGDESDNIGTGALTAFASRLIGYNLITGTYSLKGEGRSLALSVDADLSAAALEALEGYRGTVLVCNYKTGEILCNVSLPAYDPADPPEDLRQGPFPDRIHFPHLQVREDPADPSHQQRRRRGLPVSFQDITDI